MIRNDRQLAFEKKEAANLADLIKDLEHILNEGKSDISQSMQCEIFKSRFEEITNDILEYETLKSYKDKDFEVNSNHYDIKKAIMCFRIASGLTQKDIADKIEIHEQQIQRYEQQDYLNASFERIIQLLNVLGVEVILKKTFKHKENTFLSGDNGKTGLIQQKAKKTHCIMAL